METMLRNEVNNEIILGLKNLFKMAMPKSDYTKWYTLFKEDKEPEKHIYNLVDKAKESMGFKSLNAVLDEEKEIIKIYNISEHLCNQPVIRVLTKKTIEFADFTALILLAINDELSLAYTKMENYNVESEEFDYEIICDGKDEIWGSLEKITGLDYYEMESAFESAMFTNESENNMIVKIAGKEYVVDVL